MEWTTIISILVPLTAFFSFLYKELKEWRKETRDETKAIRIEIQEQVKRSDRLYEMFITLLEKQTSKSNP